jgi:hypothetical protein
MKYRILKKYTTSGQVYYYPQYKFLFWWLNFDDDRGDTLYYFEYSDAAKKIDQYVKAKTFKDQPDEYIPYTYENESKQYKRITIPGLESSLIYIQRNSKYDPWICELSDLQVETLEKFNEQD